MCIPSSVKGWPVADLAASEKPLLVLEVGRDVVIISQTAAKFKH
jgi:hypothetical protein